VNRWLSFLIAPAIVAITASAADKEPVERTAYLMGTSAHLVTWDETREEGLRRLERALGELEATEAELSTWREDSAITALNRTKVANRDYVRAGGRRMNGGTQTAELR